MNRRAHKRRAGPIGGVIIVGIGIILSIVFVVPRLFTAKDNGQRISFVIASSPISVWSCDHDVTECTVLNIPSEMAVDAVHGYGVYSLEALWKLGAMDKQSGSVLSESVGDALGVPVQYYFGEKRENIPMVTDAVEYGKSIFSTSRILPYMFGRYRTNIPLTVWFAVSKFLISSRPERFKQLNPADPAISIEEELPDATKRQVLDRGLLDYTLSGVFENDTLRKESMTVAVFNSTQMSSLGSRIARFFTNSGINVVTVGNEESSVGSCVLSGNTTALKSQTARYIKQLLNCSEKAGNNDNRSDLIVHVGSDNAKQYESSGK